MNPRHSDEHCRDPDHPRQRKTKRNPRGAAARATHTDDLTALATSLQQLINPATEETDEQNTASTFLLDSAAHPTHTKHPTPNMQPLLKPISTKTVTNHTTKCTHHGKVTIQTNEGKIVRVPAVTNPSICQNLLSVHSLTKYYGPVLFTQRRAYMFNTRQSHSPELISSAPWDPRCRAYRLVNSKPATARGVRTYMAKRGIKCTPLTIPQRSTPTSTTKRTQPNTIPALPDNTQATRAKSSNIQTRTHQPNLRKAVAAHPAAFHDWHLIRNHTPPRNMQKMAKEQTIPALPAALQYNPPDITCASCAHAKLLPAPHKPNRKNYKVGAYISSDTCGPIKPPSRHGTNHFLTFIDAQSRYLILYFLKDRREVGLVIPALFSLITAHSGSPPKVYRTDNAKEFCSKTSTAVYKQYGTEHGTTTPHQPQENSRAERINMTLLNAARAALHHAKLDMPFWEDVVRDAAFKYNIMRHKSHGKSPYELWHAQTPTLKRLFAFGQYGHIPVHKPKKKLDARADSVRYMYGVSDTHICVLKPSTGQYHTVRVVDFHPYEKQSDPSQQHTSVFQTESSNTNAQPQTNPRNHTHARQYQDATEWAVAHDSELDSLDDTGTIMWIPDNELPPKAKTIPLKMTYRYKEGPNNDIIRKARCSVRGDLMRAHTHYNPEQTTTYMAEKATVRLIMAISAANQWNIAHFDIKAAYLHEPYHHDKPIYIRQHPKFDGTFKHNCKAGILKRNLYGTPPASTIYYSALVKHMKANNFTQCQADPCLFAKIVESTGDITLVAVSMDDFLVTASNPRLITDLYNHLSTKYQIKHLGEPHTYLNWKVHIQQNRCIHISQTHTIQHIIHKMKMHNCNTKHTPLPEKINNHEAEAAHPLESHMATTFRQAVGDIRYVADSTRPDIYHAVNRLASVMHKPTTTHWHQLKWLLRYLKHTASWGILFPTRRDKQQKPILRTFSDAGYANTQDRKSYTGVIHTLNNAPISWTSSKQSVVALSTCEAEYLAASTAVQQTQWLRRVLLECNQSQTQPTPLYIDNNCAIQVANNTAPTKRRKLIDIRHHHLHNHIDRRNISVQHIPSATNLADTFTKPIGKTRFSDLIPKLQIVPCPSLSPGTDRPTAHNDNDFSIHRPTGQPVQNT